MIRRRSTFLLDGFDLLTGRFTQEDPIGIAGGVNLYAYSGNNPAMFTDPFGLCENEQGQWRRCKVTLSIDGKALGADLSALTPETRQKLQDIADASDRDLGINATTNGVHQDWRHGTGEGVDIGSINGKDIGSGSTTGPGMSEEATRVQGVIAGMSAELRVASNLGPAGKYIGTSGPQPFQTASTRDQHANHIHTTFDRGRGRASFWRSTNRAALNALSP